MVDSVPGDVNLAAAIERFLAVYQVHVAPRDADRDTFRIETQLYFLCDILFRSAHLFLRQKSILFRVCTLLFLLHMSQ